jgi:hypothetical protein
VAGKATSLTIRIVSDAKSAAAGFSEAESRVDKFRSGMDKASVAAAGVVAGVLAIGGEAAKAASDLQQSAGAVETVFGKQAAAIQASAATAANAVGLSANQYNEMASVIGSQLKNMGIAHDQLVPKTQNLITLGADLAATYGGTAADAVEALSALLRGETDPIERYGVSIKQSDINARMAADGTAKLTGAQAKAAQAQAVLALLSQQTGQAVGSFGREADTAAGQTQRAQASFENAKAALGEALLPVLTEGAQDLATFGHWAEQNSGTVQVLVGVVGGLAAAILIVNGAMKAWAAGQAIVTAAQWALNVAMDANPLGLVIIAITAIIAGVILMYNKFGWFRDFVHTVGAGFAAAFDGIKSAIGWVVDKIQWLINAGGKAIGWVKNLFSAPAAPAPAPGGGGGPAAGGPRWGGGGAPLAAVRWGGGGAPVGGGGGGIGGGGGGPAPMVVNVTINGALDPVAVGRQVVDVLREYSRTTGRQVSVTMGGLG